MDTPSKTIVAVDVMGSDLGPLEILEGVFLSLNESNEDDFSLILVGDEAIIRPFIAQPRFEKYLSRLQVCHASQVIEMNEKPTRVLRTKKDASMARAIELVKDGKADGILSCGNTGSLVALSTIKLRPLKNLERPALATVIPAINHQFVLLDVGANPESSPEQLLHNAILGAHYCQVALGLSRPRVGLLSIGTEEGKGNERVQKAHELLKRVNGEIRYEGLVEGFQLFRNGVDVVVCDGFVGNILLKSMESLAKEVKGFLKKELLKNPLRIFGCLFSIGALRSIRKKLSAEKYGGAPLLGLNGSVFKAHGGSNRQAIKYAILIAKKFAKSSEREWLARKIETVLALEKSASEAEEIKA